MSPYKRWALLGVMLVVALASISQVLCHDEKVEVEKQWPEEFVEEEENFDYLDDENELGAKEEPEHEGPGYNGPPPVPLPRPLPYPPPPHHELPNHNVAEVEKYEDQAPQGQSYHSLPPAQNYQHQPPPSPNYSQPPPPPPSYSQPPPVANYSMHPPPPPPVYHPAPANYSAGPAPEQYMGLPMFNIVEEVSYQPVYIPTPPIAYPGPESVINNYSVAPPPPASYPPVLLPASAYTPITQAPPSYLPPAHANYSAPPAQGYTPAPAPPASVASYQAPAQSYSPQQPRPAVANYSSAPPSYSTPAAQSYTPTPTQPQPQQQPKPQPQPYPSAPAPVSNYSSAPKPALSYTPQAAPAPATSYSPTPPSQNYRPVPLPPPATMPVPKINVYQTPPVAGVANYRVISNYTTVTQVTTTYAARPVNAGVRPAVMMHSLPRPPIGHQQGGQVARPISMYSPKDLAPFIPPMGYRENHWSLSYYRSAPYRNCPKHAYLQGPSPRDLEAAFAYAQQQLAMSRGATINYLGQNATSQQSSWAARHHLFSFLSQQNARMDEEGLLVELVSQYLSDRACLTKWDKQRYLPQLTKVLSVSHFPEAHSCSNLYRNQWQGNARNCWQSKYRTIDGFCNNPEHPYWGKSNVCHIRLLSPDYADGISAPRNAYNPRTPLPNPRVVSNYIHNDIPLDGPYNLMKMQWGQFINHDITNTALSSYDGLVDCCKNPGARGCWPIYVPPGDPFYRAHNVTCLSFIRSGVCPICQLGPRQQINKNTAFLDASHIYGNNPEQATQLRAFRGGLLRFSNGKNGEVLLPIANAQEQQCSGTCFHAGDSRVNQHPALTALHTLLLRSHNHHARALGLRHPNWSDEVIFQEARRINIAEYQMITYAEYLPIVFGPILSAYYHLLPSPGSYTQWNPKTDPTTWNEYSTAACRFGHSQIQATFGLYSKIAAYGQQDPRQAGFRLKEWFLRPSLLSDGLLQQIINGLLSRPSLAVDPWITNDVRNHLYQSHKEHSGGDLAATNIWRGRDHGIPGYIHYVEYCFNHKVRSWKDLSLFIPQFSLNQLHKLYKTVENIDLFTGGMAERHFPGADIGPTFACINGIQYYHLKFGDRYFFEHGNQAGSFAPAQLEEIKRSTLARFLCRTAYLPNVPQYAFLQPSQFNPLVNCSMLGELDYSKF